MAIMATEAAILSVISGKMLVKDFSELHRVIQAMAGGEVWTHQIPSVMRAMKGNMERAYPDLATIDTSTVTPETVAAWTAAHPDLYAKMREVKPLGDFALRPQDGLPPGVPVVRVAASPPNGKV